VTSTRNICRMRTAIIFAAARGAATAAGSFPIALTLWWLTHGVHLLTCLQAATVAQLP
jgi:hypothetical protein